MGYKNCCSPGYEVERMLAGAEYNIHSHGDIGAFYNSVMHVDLPRYATMFYRPSQHEIFSDWKYDKVQLTYDDGSREIRDSVRGAPIEAYLPAVSFIPDGITANPRLIRNPEIMPKKDVVDEITRAQAEVIGRGEGVILRFTEIEQEIHMKRTVRRLEIFNNPKKNNHSDEEDYTDKDRIDYR